MKNIFRALILGSLLGVYAHAIEPAQQVENFVKRFYVEVLERTAEPEGLNDWTNRLTTQLSAGSDVARGFIFSEEFTNKDKSDEDFVNILYSAFFNRPADTEGFNGWVSELKHGTSREDVLNGFLYSTEFANLTKTYGIKAVSDGQGSSAGGSVEDFVNRFYSEVLGRKADKKGLESWVQKLYNQESTGADIAVGFTSSVEFTSKNISNVEFVNILYRAFFNRAGDEGGVNTWLGQLESGVSKSEVVNGFLHSEEFINLCNGYGITAYEGAPKYRIAKSVVRYTIDSGYIEENTTYTYDANGNMLSSTRSNPQFSPPVQTTTYTYNDKNQMLTMTSKNSSLVYTYDNRGNVLTANEIYYSPEGDEAARYTSEYTYDAQDHMLTFDIFATYQSGETKRDDIVYTYNAQGEPATMAVKGIVYNYLYDTNNRIISEPVYFDLSGMDVMTLTYQYDDNGNIAVEKEENSNGISTTTYEYNASNTKISSTSTYTSDDFSTSYTFKYDPKGHMISVRNNIDGALSLFAYDARGNEVLSKYSSGTFSNVSYSHFTYDIHNNLISISRDGTLVQENEWIVIP